MKIYSLIILCLTLLVSAQSFAHAGHDHTTMLSSLVHLFWLAPALIALVALYSKLLKKNYQIKTTKPQLKGNQNVV